MTDPRLQTIAPLFIVARVGLAQNQTPPSGKATSTYPLEISVLRVEHTSQWTGKSRGGSLRDEIQDEAEEIVKPKV